MKPPTRTVRWVEGHAYAVKRVKLQGTKHSVKLSPGLQTDESAGERALVLAVLAKRMAGVEEKAAMVALRLVGSARSPVQLQARLTVAEQLINGNVPRANGATMPTFGEVLTQWADGTLAKRFKDSVSAIRHGEKKAVWMRPHLSAILDMPIDCVTLDACAIVMRGLPDKMAMSTRAQFAKAMKHLLTLAVFPLQLITHNPLPKGFVPKVTKSKAFGFLYPCDDAALLACTVVPLYWRIFWGTLAREGMRGIELAGLNIEDVNASGVLSLDKTKTDQPRQWVMDAAVRRAHELYRKHFRTNARPGDALVVDEHADRLSQSVVAHVAEHLRKHLLLAGVDKQRPELFRTTEHRRQMRSHDLRATCVTVHLANDKSERWVTARTGHKSSAMVAKYSRQIDALRELDMGDFEPLDQAIPELRALVKPPPTGHPLDNAGRKYAKPLVHEIFGTDICATLEASAMTKNPTITQPAPGSSPTQLDAIVQSLSSLAAAVATLAERVSALETRELDGLAEATATSVVAKLEARGALPRPAVKLALVPPVVDEAEPPKSPPRPRSRRSK